jgi:hypothetical protein
VLVGVLFLVLILAYRAQFVIMHMRDSALIGGTHRLQGVGVRLGPAFCIPSHLASTFWENYLASWPIEMRVHTCYYAPKGLSLMDILKPKDLE